MKKKLNSLELCVTRETGRFYLASPITITQSGDEAKCWGSRSYFTSLKSPGNRAWHFQVPHPCRGLLQITVIDVRPKEGPRAVGLTLSTARCRDIVSLCLLFFSHLKSSGSFCFYSEGKGTWAQFSEMRIKEQMGCIWRSLSDLASPWAVKRLCWPKMHIPAPAPVPARQSELTKGAQWCVKIRNKSLERGHGGTWALRGGFGPSAAKLEPPDSGE